MLQNHPLKNNIYTILPPMIAPMTGATLFMLQCLALLRLRQLTTLVLLCVVEQLWNPWILNICQSLSVSKCFYTVTSTLTSTWFVCRPPGLHQCLEPQDLWSKCPPDVLARCFKSQQDYTDNSAAACVSTTWRDAFWGCAEQIKIQQNPFNMGSLSSTYLQQFTRLHTVELGLGPEWQQQQSSITLQQHRLQGAIHWTEMMHSIPTSCCCLRLDVLKLDAIPASRGALNELTNLQSLYIYSNQTNHVSLEVIANLLQLQLLSLVGVGTKVYGGLKCLPTGITNLQLNKCREVPVGSFCLQALSRLPNISSLDFSYCVINFGEEAGGVDLQHIKVLVLEGAVVRSSPEAVLASLTTAKQLQDLNLRSLCFGGYSSDLQLGKLLSSLQSLQKLDVTSCRHVHFGPSEYTRLKLHCFACQYSQLGIVEAVPFSPFPQEFQTREGNTIRPSLQVEGDLRRQQNWIRTLPVTALTHVTIQYGRQWLLAWSLDFEVLPNLLYLDITLLSYQSADQNVSFPASSKLQELYIRGTQCAVVDLAECTNLTSLGIVYEAGYTMQDLGLPTSLERLCLYNVLREGSHPELRLLTNLEHLKVGARATADDYMTHLPRLPPSLLKLDLLDGGMTNLDQLTLLTRLKKLGMPSLPNTQQMSVIKRLHQLRHVSETKGMQSLPVSMCLHCNNPNLVLSAHPMLCNALPDSVV